MSLIESNLPYFNTFFGGEIEAENEYLVITKNDYSKNYTFIETFETAKLFYDDNRVKNNTTYIKMYKIGVKAVSDWLRYGDKEEDDPLEKLVEGYVIESDYEGSVDYSKCDGRMDFSDEEEE